VQYLLAHHLYEDDLLWVFKRHLRRLQLGALHGESFPFLSSSWTAAPLRPREPCCVILTKLQVLQNLRPFLFLFGVVHLHVIADARAHNDVASLIISLSNVGDLYAGRQATRFAPGVP